VSTHLTPLRWPESWTDPGALDLLADGAINCLLFGKSASHAAVRARAGQKGLRVISLDALPDNIKIVQGAWPGIRRPAAGDGGSAGPTGVPWVDSNGWLSRLTIATSPGASIWIDAHPPAKDRLSPGAYILAFADSAVHGARWIVTLDPALASGIAAKKPEALAAFKRMQAAARFFSSHSDWDAYTPEATAGVVSRFTGGDETFSHELLNLLDRANVHNRILLKDNPLPLDGLRAAIYSDEEAPTPAVRKQLLAFVEAGGMLITSKKWGDLPGTAAAAEHPRFDTRKLGRGVVHFSKEGPGDPYEWANDSAILISHRHDLVRFWNCGAAGSHYVKSPDGRRAAVHLFFYGGRGPDSAAVRVKGAFQGVKILTTDSDALRPLHIEQQNGAVEVHLPQLPQYAVLMLSRDREGAVANHHAEPTDKERRS
jgi:hypothetical protein